MNKKKLFIKILLSVLSLALIVFLIIFINKQYNARYNGMITVQVIDIDGNITKEKDIKFSKGDKLRDLISNNFDNFIIEESEYGAYVIRIEDIVQSEIDQIYIALYYNDDYATSGLDSLEYEDGSTISFKETKF